MKGESDSLIVKGGVKLTLVVFLDLCLFLSSSSSFINGSSGEIRLGDFGLSAHRTCTHVASVLGTPEFMAPELYEEQYSESVDIYAFGMAVLEMTTKEYPYEECSNAAQIWKKVTGGCKPDVLQRVHDPQVREFINLCICPQSDRLSASELLQHPFLSFRNSDSFFRDNMVVVVDPKSKPGSRAGSKPTSQEKETNTMQQQQQQHQQHMQQQQPYQPQQHPPPKQSTNLKPQPVQSSHPPDPLHTPVPTPTQPSPAPGVASTVSAIMVDIESAHGATANIVLHIHLDNGRRKKQIKFALDFRSDTSMSLAGEMVQSLKLPDGERTQMLIASAMEQKIEPVRKAYFAHMAEESISPPGTGSADLQEHQHTPPPIEFQHTSYTAHTSPTGPMPNGGQSIYTPQAQLPIRPLSQVGSQPRPMTAATPLPAPAKPVTPHTLPPSRPPSAASNHSALSTPSNSRQASATPAGAIDNMGVGGGVSMQAREQSKQQQQQQQSRPNTAGGTVPANRTGGVTPSQSPIVSSSRMSLPPMGSTGANPPPAMASNHRHSSSSPFNTGAPYGEQFGELTELAQANEIHKLPPTPVISPTQQHHSLAHNAKTPQSPQHRPMHAPTTTSRPVQPPHTSFVSPSNVVDSAPSPCDSLLTLDAFESSEAYEDYLSKQFKQLSVSTLKEKLKGKPGGMDLVKACFEKPDLIQMLIRITVQEGASLTHGGSNAANGNTNQHRSTVMRNVDTPDFLSPDPPVLPTSPSVYPSHVPTSSPDPFVGLDALMTSPTEHATFTEQFPHTAHTTKKTQQQHHAATMIQPHTQSPTDTNQQHHHHQHHVHRSLDSIPVLSPTATSTSISNFPFSPVGAFSNHSSDSGSIHSHRPPSDEELTATGSDDPSAFDFQVSVTSPASSPDVGLDAPVDFLSPESSPPPPVLDVSTPTAGTSEPQVAPQAQSKPFYDLLSESQQTTKQARAHSQERSRRHGSTLGGVLEQGEEEEPHHHHHRLSHHQSMPAPLHSDSSPDGSLPSLTDLMSGGGSSRTSPNKPASSRKPSLDPELNAFFTQPRKTDLLVPSSAHHLIPGTAALESHHEKQRNATKTLPANFALELDMFGGSPSSGVTATGTKPQRSHTASSVDPFDPFFFPTTNNPSATPIDKAHKNTQSFSIPMSQHNATSIFTAGPPTKEDIEARKQQRTKSEADQAEAAILQGFQM